MKNALRARPVPPKFKVKFGQAFFKKFTFMERLRILFGFRILVRFDVLSEHHPGRIDATMLVATTEAMIEKLDRQF